MIIQQLVVSDYLYKTNKNGIKNFNQIEQSLNNSSDLFKEKRKVNIASIAEVLSLPRETVRRKVLYLSKIRLLDYTKSGIGIGSEYKTVFNEFVADTVSKMSQLIKNIIQLYKPLENTGVSSVLVKVLRSIIFFSLTFIVFIHPI